MAFLAAVQRFFCGQRTLFIYIGWSTWCPAASTWLLALQLATPMKDDGLAPMKLPPSSSTVV